MPSSGCEEDGAVSSTTSIQRVAALNPEVEAIKPQVPAFTHSASVDQSCESTINKA